MMEEGFIFRVFSIFEWIVTFAYMQLVWMVLTIVGLGVFGLFPSTIALFSVSREILKKKNDVPILSYMWKIYKKEFIKSNLYFYSLFVFGALIYFYIRFFMYQEVGFYTILYFLSIGIGVLYLLSFIVALAVYVHYSLSLISFYKAIWFIVLSYPFHMITIGVVIIGFYYIMTLIPGLLPFISFSVVAYLLMGVSNLIFRKIDRKLIISMDET